VLHFPQMTRDQKVALPLILVIFALPIIFVLVQRSRSNGVSSNSRGRARITYEPELTTAAENSEIWSIIRNEKGRLERIEVKRTVKGR